MPPSSVALREPSSSSSATSSIPNEHCIPHVSNALIDLEHRALYKSHAWLAELYCAVVELYPNAPIPSPSVAPSIKLHESALLIRARSLFHLHEYARAADLLSSCKSSVAIFLRLYAQFLAIQVASRGRAPSDADNARLRTLREQVATAVKRCSTPDGYLLYLRGSVERKLGLESEARKSLLDGACAAPWNWGCWLELARCTSSPAAARTQLQLAGAGGVMGALYLAHVCNERDALDDARHTYELMAQALPRWAYAQAQRALVLYNQRLFDEASALYEQLFDEDAQRLADSDVYSNILFVKEDKPRLSQLANRCLKIDRVALETCVVIGNYMSLRQEHEEAVTYFRRALRLNPAYLSAWTLMGHEYVEMKNAAAAIEAYRRAVDINKNDFRAWYGLGQTYELMQMPAFTLYYFRKAASLRPRDARMWCAVGHTYEELGKTTEAIQCYERAVGCDEEDGVARAKLEAIKQLLEEEKRKADPPEEPPNEHLEL